MPDANEDSADILESIRMLRHEIGTHLTVVSMGLEALVLVREDVEQFDAMVDGIRQDGVEPLRHAIGALVEKTRLLGDRAR